MNEPFKTTERFVIQRRWENSKNSVARHWNDFQYQPDGRTNWFEDAVFKTLAEAKRVQAKLIKTHGACQYRIVSEVRTYTIIED